MVDLRLVRLPQSSDTITEAESAKKVVEVGINGMIYGTGIMAIAQLARLSSQNPTLRQASQLGFKVAAAGTGMATLVAMVGGLGWFTEILVDKLDDADF